MNLPGRIISSLPLMNTSPTRFNLSTEKTISEWAGKFKSAALKPGTAAIKREFNEYAKLIQKQNKRNYDHDEWQNLFKAVDRTLSELATLPAAQDRFTKIREIFGKELIEVIKSKINSNKPQAVVSALSAMGIYSQAGILVLREILLADALVLGDHGVNALLQETWNSSNEKLSFSPAQAREAVEYLANNDTAGGKSLLHTLEDAIFVYNVHDQFIGSEDKIKILKHVLGESGIKQFVMASQQKAQSKKLEHMAEMLTPNARRYVGEILSEEARLGNIYDSGTQKTIKDVIVTVIIDTLKDMENRGQQISQPQILAHMLPRLNEKFKLYFKLAQRTEGKSLKGLVEGLKMAFFALPGEIDNVKTKAVIPPNPVQNSDYITWLEATQDAILNICTKAALISRENESVGNRETQHVSGRFIADIAVFRTLFEGLNLDQLTYIQMQRGSKPADKVSHFTIQEFNSALINYVEETFKFSSESKKELLEKAKQAPIETEIMLLSTTVRTEAKDRKHLLSRKPGEVSTEGRSVHTVMPIGKYIEAKSKACDVWLQMMENYFNEPKGVKEKIKEKVKEERNLAQIWSGRSPQDKEQIKLKIAEGRGIFKTALQGDKKELRAAILKLQKEESDLNSLAFPLPVPQEVKKDWLERVGNEIKILQDLLRQYADVEESGAASADAGKWLRQGRPDLHKLQLIAGELLQMMNLTRNDIRQKKGEGLTDRQADQKPLKARLKEVSEYLEGLKGTKDYAKKMKGGKTGLFPQVYSEAVTTLGQYQRLLEKITSDLETVKAGQFLKRGADGILEKLYELLTIAAEHIRKHENHIKDNPTPGVHKEYIRKLLYAVSDHVKATVEQILKLCSEKLFVSEKQKDMATTLVSNATAAKLSLLEQSSGFQELFQEYVRRDITKLIKSELRGIPVQDTWKAAAGLSEKIIAEIQRGTLFMSNMNWPYQLAATATENKVYEIVRAVLWNNRTQPAFITLVRYLGIQDNTPYSDFDQDDFISPVVKGIFRILKRVSDPAKGQKVLQDIAAETVDGFGTILSPGVHASQNQRVTTPIGQKVMFGQALRSLKFVLEKTFKDKLPEKSVAEFEGWDSLDVLDWQRPVRPGNKPIATYIKEFTEAAEQYTNTTMLTEDLQTVGEMQAFLYWLSGGQTKVQISQTGLDYIFDVLNRRPEELMPPHLKKEDVADPQNKGKRAIGQWQLHMYRNRYFSVLTDLRYWEVLADLPSPHDAKQVEYARVRRVLDKYKVILDRWSASKKQESAKIYLADLRELDIELTALVGKRHHAGGQEYVGGYRIHTDLKKAFGELAWNEDIIAPTQTLHDEIEEQLEEIKDNLIDKDLDKIDYAQLDPVAFPQLWLYFAARERMQRISEDWTALKDEEDPGAHLDEREHLAKKILDIRIELNIIKKQLEACHDRLSNTDIKSYESPYEQERFGNRFKLYQTWMSRATKMLEYELKEPQHNLVRHDIARYSIDLAGEVIEGWLQAEKAFEAKLKEEKPKETELKAQRQYLIRMSEVVSRDILNMLKLLPPLDAKIVLDSLETAIPAPLRPAYLNLVTDLNRWIETHAGKVTGYYQTSADRGDMPVSLAKAQLLPLARRIRDEKFIGTEENPNPQFSTPLLKGFETCIYTIVKAGIEKLGTQSDRHSSPYSIEVVVNANNPDRENPFENEFQWMNWLFPALLEANGFKHIQWGNTDGLFGAWKGKDGDIHGIPRAKGSTGFIVAGTPTPRILNAEKQKLMDILKKGGWLGLSVLGENFGKKGEFKGEFINKKSVEEVAPTSQITLVDEGNERDEFRSKMITLYKRALAFHDWLQGEGQVLCKNILADLRTILSADPQDLDKGHIPFKIREVLNMGDSELNQALKEIKGVSAAAHVERLAIYIEKLNRILLPHLIHELSTQAGKTSASLEQATSLRSFLPRLTRELSDEQSQKIWPKLQGHKDAYALIQMWSLLEYDSSDSNEREAQYVTYAKLKFWLGLVPTDRNMNRYAAFLADELAAELQSDEEEVGKVEVELEETVMEILSSLSTSPLHPSQRKIILGAMIELKEGLMLAKTKDVSEHLKFSRAEVLQNFINASQTATDYRILPDNITEIDPGDIPKLEDVEEPSIAAFGKSYIVSSKESLGKFIDDITPYQESIQNIQKEYGFLKMHFPQFIKDVNELARQLTELKQNATLLYGEWDEKEENERVQEFTDLAKEGAVLGAKVEGKEEVFDHLKNIQKLSGQIDKLTQEDLKKNEEEIKRLRELLRAEQEEAQNADAALKKKLKEIGAGRIQAILNTAQIVDPENKQHFVDSAKGLLKRAENADTDVNLTKDIESLEKAVNEYQKFLLESRKADLDSINEAQDQDIKGLLKKIEEHVRTLEIGITSFNDPLGGVEKLSKTPLPKEVKELIALKTLLLKAYSELIQQNGRLGGFTGLTSHVKDMIQALKTRLASLKNTTFEGAIQTLEQKVEETIEPGLNPVEKRINEVKKALDKLIGSVDKAIQAKIDEQDELNEQLQRDLRDAKQDAELSAKRAQDLQQKLKQLLEAQTNGISTTKLKDEENRLALENLQQEVDSANKKAAEAEVKLKKLETTSKKNEQELAQLREENKKTTKEKSQLEDDLATLRDQLEKEKQKTAYLEGIIKRYRTPQNMLSALGKIISGLKLQQFHPLNTALRQCAEKKEKLSWPDVLKLNEELNRYKLESRLKKMKEDLLKFGEEKVPNFILAKIEDAIQRFQKGELTELEVENELAPLVKQVKAHLFLNKSLTDLFNWARELHSKRSISQETFDTFKTGIKNTHLHGHKTMAGYEDLRRLVTVPTKLMGAPQVYAEDISEIEEQILALSDYLKHSLIERPLEKKSSDRELLKKFAERGDQTYQRRNAMFSVDMWTTKSGTIAHPPKTVRKGNVDDPKVFILTNDKLDTLKYHQEDYRPGDWVQKDLVHSFATKQRELKCSQTETEIIVRGQKKTVVFEPIEGNTDFYLVIAA